MKSYLSTVFTHSPYLTYRTEIILWIYTISVLFHLTSISSEYVEPGPKYACPKDRISIHPCSCVRGADAGLTIECQNSNLASLAVGISNLASIRSKIERLTISFCNICESKRVSFILIWAPITYDYHTLRILIAFQLTYSAIYCTR